MSCACLNLQFQQSEIKIGVKSLVKIVNGNYTCLVCNKACFNSKETLFTLTPKEIQQSNPSKVYKFVIPNHPISAPKPDLEGPLEEYKKKLQFELDQKLAIYKEQLERDFDFKIAVALRDKERLMELFQETTPNETEAPEERDDGSSHSMHNSDISDYEEDSVEQSHVGSLPVNIPMRRVTIPNDLKFEPPHLMAARTFQDSFKPPGPKSKIEY
jgi:hypothetical protein